MNIINVAATIAYKGPSFEVNCDFCGCKYLVEPTLQDGHNEREEYWCPECSKEGGTVRANNTPKVTLIKGRTDGKTTSYKE